MNFTSCQENWRIDSEGHPMHYSNISIVDAVKKKEQLPWLVALMQMCRINELPYFVGRSFPFYTSKFTRYTLKGKYTESSSYETVDRSKWKFWNWSV